MLFNYTPYEQIGVGVPKGPEWFYVYHLVDPRDNTVRYVGKTNDFVHRHRGHLSSSQLKQNTHKNNWVKSLKKIGLEPTLRIRIACKSEAEAYAQEVKEIAELKAAGCKLTNGNSGGLGASHTEESKRKISEKLTGITRSQESIQKSANAQRGQRRPKWAPERYKKFQRVEGFNKETKETVVFVSAKEAGRCLGISPSRISSCCKGRKHYNSAGGYTWKYKE